jgi:hypothetical protein
VNPSDSQNRHSDWVLGHHGTWPRRLLKAWQGWEAMALNVTFFHPDDEGETEREFELPSWPWRWVCWLQGHRENYGECVICRKGLA